MVAGGIFMFAVLIEREEDIPDRIKEEDIWPSDTQFWCYFGTVLLLEQLYLQQRYTLHLDKVLPVCEPVNSPGSCLRL